jgi:hypothetical protein
MLERRKIISPATEGLEIQCRQGNDEDKEVSAIIDLCLEGCGVQGK